ncbi:TBC domain-containing protein [Durotheca rogersii]|uniref:TBC domain-containing protein n=1 Tax=Durotheca rogersii TaxID=419775 RepID=UPI00221E5966|nr:TBC domain-containing protein [Durotheca rogersii]KAI5867363.1 TBC domain-containing protein [Durotheca rogersii]
MAAGVSPEPERGVEFQGYGVHASPAQEYQGSKHPPDDSPNFHADIYDLYTTDPDGYEADEDNDFEATATTTSETIASWTTHISPLSPRWDSLGYRRPGNCLGPASPVPGNYHAKSTNTTDESRPGVHPLTSRARHETHWSPTTKMNATEPARVDNFSRPRTASIKQSSHESPWLRPANLSSMESGQSQPEFVVNYTVSWPRERGHSVSSNVSASTFASVPVRAPPDMYGRENHRGRGRQPQTPLSRPPLLYSRAESSGPTFARDPIPRMASLPSEELRSSYRSQLSTSTAQGTLATERSSVATKSSSITSVYEAVDAVDGADDDFSLDDIMGMYEKGFHDSMPEDDDSRPPTAKSELSRRRASVLEAISGPLLPRKSLISPPVSELTARNSTNMFHDSDMQPLPEESEDQEAEGENKIIEAEDEGDGRGRANKADHDNSYHDNEVGNDNGDGNGDRTIGNGEDEVGDEELPPPMRRQTDLTIAEDDDERDRYGFRKSNQYINREQYDDWNQGYIEYLARRRRKWVVFLKENGLMTDNPNRFPPRSAKTKRFVRKGIPPDWRGAAWFYYAGGPAVVAKHAGVYENLLKQTAKEVDVEAIERDLHRTFPDNVRFRNARPSATSSAATTHGSSPRTPMSPGTPRRRWENASREDEKPMISSLRRVLHAFSIYNPRIGYCQSLNFLAGLLLLFVESEEHAFWLLNIITRVYLPGTHEMNLEGANVDLGVLMSSLRDAMPNVWAKIGGELDGTDAVRPKTRRYRHNKTEPTRLPPITLCMTAWFMSCYIGTLPIESTLRVWDVFFYEGSKTLFRIALAIFKMGENEIKAVGDPMEIFQVVQTIPRRLVDANRLIEACFRRRNGFGHISQETVEQKRQERRIQVKAEREKLATT